jgi:hypothetical protein
MVLFIGFVVLLLATILQTTVVTRLPLLEGPADVVMLVLLGWISRQHVEGDWGWAVMAGLMVGLASAMPIWVPLAAYLALAWTTRFLHNRVWQVPVLSLFTTTFLGTLLVHGLAYGFVVVSGANLTFGEAFNLVILPSLILNLILALPVYGIMGELAKLLLPAEVTDERI